MHQEAIWACTQSQTAVGVTNLEHIACPQETVPYAQGPSPGMTVLYTLWSNADCVVSRGTGRDMRFLMSPRTHLVDDFEVLQLAARVDLLVHAHIVPVPAVRNSTAVRVLV
jgi:hypothetical protein